MKVILKCNILVMIYNIILVPMEAGQQSAERLEKAGIKGILNFTPIRLHTGSDVTVHSIDLGVELQALFFQMKNK